MTWQWLVGVFAVYRLVRLVILDRITLPIRGRIIRWAYQHEDGADVDVMEPRTLAEWDELAHQDDDSPGLAYLLTCWWCAGLWVSIGGTVWWWAHPESAYWAALALSLSGALVIVDRLESLLAAHGDT